MCNIASVQYNCVCLKSKTLRNFLPSSSFLHHFYGITGNSEQKNTLQTMEQLICCYKRTFYKNSSFSQTRALNTIRGICRHYIWPLCFIFKLGFVCLSSTIITRKANACSLLLFVNDHKQEVFRTHRQDHFFK